MQENWAPSGGKTYSVEAIDSDSETVFSAVIQGQPKNWVQFMDTARLTISPRQLPALSIKLLPWTEVGGMLGDAGFINSRNTDI